MKLLVFSDSHKHIAKMQNVLEKHGEDADCVLHLGDCCVDAERMAHKFPQLKFLWVSGNCDYSYEPAEKLLSLGGKKIFVTHGHQYHVKTGYQRIVYSALERGADACFFVHSHQPDVFYESGVLFLNPGSISLPRGMSPPSYGVAEISENRIGGKIFSCLAPGV